MSSVSAVAWVVVAVSCALALRGAGADRLTVALMWASLQFAQHPVPIGTLGMLAFFAAAYRWDRHKEPSSAPSDATHQPQTQTGMTT